MIASWIEKWRARGKTAKYSLRLTLLALFLSLAFGSFALIISFTKSREYDSIFAFSKILSEESAEVIRSQFEEITAATERNVATITSLFPLAGDLDFNNPIILSYLLNAEKYTPHFGSLYMGLENGDCMGVFRSSLMSHYATTYYPSNPTKLLPPNIDLILMTIDASQTPSVTHLTYFNSALEQLATDTILSPFNATQRPWYKGAIEQGHLFWTDWYHFFPLETGGITAAAPLIKEGKIVGVVGADLTGTLLAEFVSRQQDVSSGKAFILDKQGHIIIPDSASGEIDADLVKEIYAHFLLNHPSSDLLFEKNGVKYLSFLTGLPSLFGQSWNLITIAPLDKLIGPVLKTQHTILTFIVVMVFISSLIVIYLAKKMSAPIVTLAEEIKKIQHLDLFSTVRVQSAIKEIFVLDNTISVMRRVVQSFAKYIPKELVAQLFDLNKEVSIGGEKREMTIFFSDIANFTTIAESQPIDVLMPLLTEYLEAMSEIIHKQEGTIDKFIGDGIMAFWGAPTPITDHAIKACDAALLCHAMLTEFNAKRRLENKVEFPTRFGIHLGTVIVGNIGTEDRLNYTVIGDAVNATAQLQEIDKNYHTAILISQEVYEQLSHVYVCRPLDEVIVKGKRQAIKIYELKGKLGGPEQIIPSADEIALCKAFTTAYIAQEEGRLEEAKEGFSALALAYPEDFPTRMHLDRLSAKEIDT